MVLINHKDVKDKEMLARICADGEMKEAMETLTVLSADKEARRAYQRRMDNLFIWNEQQARLKEYIAIIANKDTQLSDKDAIIANKDTQLSDKDAIIANKDTQLFDKDAIIANKDTQLSDKDAIIAKLRAQIAQADKPKQ